MRNKKGHLEDNCYVKSNNIQHNINENKSNNQSIENKIQKIETTTGIKIYGTIEEFTKKIKDFWPQAAKILSIFPPHYNILPTLKRNE